MGILSTLGSKSRLISNLLVPLNLIRMARLVQAQAPDTTRSFRNYDLGRLPAHEIGAILASAHPDEPCLNLINNKLDLITAAELGGVFKAIKPKVKILQLRQNRLGALGEELATAIAEIPDSVSELDLTWNDLGDLGGTGLASTLAAVRSKNLKLGSNNLSIIEADALGSAMARLHKGLESLTLSDNQLNAKQLTAAISNAPKDLKNLNIARNDLDTLPADDLASVLAAAKFAKSIDLRGNNLGAVPVANLVKAFNSLPEGLEELGLADNAFCSMSPKDFATVMKALPKGLKAIQLRLNLLEPEAIKAIPDTITNIDVLDNLASHTSSVAKYGLFTTSVNNILKNTAATAAPETKPQLF